MDAPNRPLLAFSSCEERELMVMDRVDLYMVWCPAHSRPPSDLGDARTRASYCRDFQLPEKRRSDTPGRVFLRSSNSSFSPTLQPCTYNPNQPITGWMQTRVRVESSLLVQTIFRPFTIFREPLNLTTLAARILAGQCGFEKLHWKKDSGQFEQDPYSREPIKLAGY